MALYALGHYAAAFTLDTYEHVTEQMRRQGAQKMDQYLDNSKQDNHFLP